MSIISDAIQTGNVSILRGLGFEIPHTLDIKNIKTYFSFKNLQNQADQYKCPIARYNLSLFYEYGVGTEINPGASLEYCRRAIETDFAPAQFKLFETYKNAERDEDRDFSYQMLEKAVAREYPPALYEMYNTFMDSELSVERKKAEEHLQKAAATNYPKDLYNLAMFQLSKGDFNDAMSNIEKASNMSHLAALEYLIGYYSDLQSPHYDISKSNDYKLKIDKIRQARPVRPTPIASQQLTTQAARSFPSATLAQPTAKQQKNGIVRRVVRRVGDTFRRNNQTSAPQKSARGSARPQ